MQQKKKTRSTPAGFDVDDFKAPGLVYGGAATIFSQGDPSDCVLYIQSGAVKLSVLSKTGKEGVIAILGPDVFFGEGALNGESHRVGSATTMMPSRILPVARDTMLRLMHDDREFCGGFISRLLERNLRAEEDLLDQLLNYSEKRLARALLLLANDEHASTPETMPKISQETLAKMIGSTRSRVNFLIRKFKRLGLIEYDGTLKVHHAALSALLEE